MTSTFDPYYQWLSIPPQEQPPDHYRLLGVKTLEANLDVIDSAADRQMKHLRDCAAGKHADDSQRLLAEVAAARVCLLDPNKKAAYDAQLKAQIASAKKKRQHQRPLAVAQPLAPTGSGVLSGSTDPLAAAPAPVEKDSRPLPSVAAAHRQRGARPLVPMLIAGVVVLLLLVIAGAAVVAFWPQGRTVAGGPGEGANGSQENGVPGTQDSVANTNDTEPGTGNSTQNTETDTNIAPPPPPPPPPPGSEDPPEETVTDNDPPLDVEEEDPPEVAPEPVVDEGPKKLPIPGKEARDQKRAQIAEIFPVAAARSFEEKGELAANLIRTARQTQDDPAAQFALLNLAREQAAEAGQIKLAFEAIDALDGVFEFDADNVRVASLEAAAKAAIPPAAKRDVVTLGMGLVDGFVAADEFDKAQALSERLVNIARPIRDAELIKALADQRRTTDALAADYRKAAAAFETMKTSPDDPEANLAAGRYLAFVEQDWERALAHLAKSSAPLLSAAAKLDLSAPTEAADQEKLADAWWAAADAENEPRVKDLCRNRSVTWYRNAVGSLTGLAKAKAIARIEVTRERDAPVAVPKSNALLARDVHEGHAGNPEHTSNSTYILRSDSRYSTATTALVVIASSELGGTSNGVIEVSIDGTNWFNVGNWSIESATLVASDSYRYRFILPMPEMMETDIVHVRFRWTSGRKRLDINSVEWRSR